MSAFTLDIGGVVPVPFEDRYTGETWATPTRWADIPPRARGYVARVLSEAFEFATKPDGSPYGFRDLEPETLLLILLDWRLVPDRSDAVVVNEHGQVCLRRAS